MEELHDPDIAPDGSLLPPGVGRHEHAAAHVTLEDCYALQFHFTPRGSETSRSVIAWRDRPAMVRPVESRKRLRDVRAGDTVFFHGRREYVVAVEIYR